MNFVELLRWQWDLYTPGHRHRVNLLIHIVAVPVFQVSTLLAIFGILAFSFEALLVGLAGMGLSAAAQGRGHKLESVPPVPFEGPRNFLSRFFAEQWITFPRFVLTGGWLGNLRKAGNA